MPEDLPQLSKLANDILLADSCASWVGPNNIELHTLFRPYTVSLHIEG
jgi:hypothetical protein